MRLLRLMIACGILGGCTHTIYDLNVDQHTVATIKKAIGEACDDKSCEVKECWRETPDFVVCNVDFSMRTSGFKQNVLARASQILSVPSLIVGFCGRDSIGSQFAFAVIGGLASGMTSAAMGDSSSVTGAASVGDTSVYGPTDLVEKACSSTPVMAITEAR